MTADSPTIYQVGQLYNPQHTSWPEGALYNYRRGGHELMLCMNKARPNEKRAIRKGPLSLALVVKQPMIVLAFRLGSMPWMDAPFSWHLVSEAERDMPSGDLEHHKTAALQVFLVDCSTGTLLAMRRVSLSSEFTRALHNAIRAQALAEPQIPTFNKQLDELYAHNATSAALASSPECVAQFRSRA